MPAHRPLAGIASSALVVLVLILGVAAAPAAAKQATFTSGEVHHDTSPPLTQIAPAPSPPPGTKKEHPQHGVPTLGSSPDPVVQSNPLLASAPALASSFEGIGLGDGYAVDSAPPDPNGAVGPNNYVEVVNEDFAVFGKSGNKIYGPVRTNTLWNGFGGGCQSNDDGDATVRYDQLANRWIISQFSVSTTPYLQCVAVSTSGDPTGSYYRYSFGGFGSDFPDYPKLGVWPDAYYTTFNLFFAGAFFSGPEVCAYDRSKMLAGLAATQQCQSPGSSYSSMLPSDLDGSTPPPSGAPNYLVALNTSSSLALWRFHVDFTNSANSTLAGPISIPVAGFSEACGGGTCIPQGGTSQQLDSLGDRLMYRLAYRNFGDHESLVVAHSVTAGSAVGARWYELRNPAGTPTVYQQGTYAPADGAYRWMPSVAMDHNGDIGLGYSISSSSAHPGISYTVWQNGVDPLGQMETETPVLTGGGSQSGSNLSRWGDYTSMAVDSSDDCTFWYTNEYLATTGAFNWNTRVATFKVPGCASAATPDYSLSASPTSQTVTQGNGTSYTVNVNPVNGYNNSVSLSASGLPAGASASFNPTSTISSSTMTVSTSSSTPAGSYPVTITGTDSNSISHSTQVTLVVSAAPVDFGLAASPSSLSIHRGSTGQYTVTITAPGGGAYTGPAVNFSVSGLPARVTGSFSPNPATSTSTLTISVNRKAATTSNRQLTITGTEGGFTHPTTVLLTIT